MPQFTTAPSNVSVPVEMLRMLMDDAQRINMQIALLLDEAGADIISASSRLPAADVVSLADYRRSRSRRAVTA